VVRQGPCDSVFQRKIALSVGRLQVHAGRRDSLVLSRHAAFSVAEIDRRDAVRRRKPSPTADAFGRIGRAPVRLAGVWDPNRGHSHQLYGKYQNEEFGAVDADTARRRKPRRLLFVVVVDVEYRHNVDVEVNDHVDDHVDVDTDATQRDRGVPTTERRPVPKG
jgi:hypothetical protein